MNYVDYKTSWGMCFGKTHLGHTSRRIRVFGAKDRSNTVNSLSATSDLKLFIKLRRLGQVSLLIKIWQREDIGPSLRGSSNQTWGVELLESVLSKVLAEEVLDCNTDVGNGLTDRCPLVHRWIVEMGC